MCGQEPLEIQIQTHTQIQARIQIIMNWRESGLVGSLEGRPAPNEGQNLKLVISGCKDKDDDKDNVKDNVVL